MPFGRVLYESGGRQDYVYFPPTSIVSLLYIMEDREIAVVGTISESVNEPGHSSDAGFRRASHCL